jgi:hypothetical protein
MDKSSAQLGVSPDGKASPLSAAASIGTPLQTLESRASNLAHQQAALVAHLATSSGLQKLVSTTHVSSAHLIDQSLQQAEAPGVPQKYLAQAVLTKTPNLPDVVS